jgi:DNA-binding transcriptional MerR regulator
MDSRDLLLKTRDLLEATGITHQVLYRYVTLGLIEEAETTEGGQRLFHPLVVPLIEQIRGLNESGYSLRDIKEIFFKEERVRRACRQG